MFASWFYYKMLTFILLCVPILFSTAMKVTTCGMCTMASVQDLGTACRYTSHTILHLEHYLTFLNLFSQIIKWGTHLTNKTSVSHVIAGWQRYFSCCSLLIILCNRLNIIVRSFKFPIIKDWDQLLFLLKRYA